METADLKYLAKNNIHLIYPDGDTAICCLWYDLERGDLQEFLRKQMKNAFCVGNLYTSRGIPKLLVGLLRFPQINHLIVFGPDVQKTGEEFYRMWMHHWKDQKFLEPEQWDYLKNNVEVSHFSSKNFEDLKIFAFDRYPPRRRDAIIIEEPAIQIPETMPSEITGWTIPANDAAQAWGDLLQTCMRFGVVKESQHRARQKEILNVTAVIKPYDVPKIAKLMKIEEDAIDRYFEQTLSEELPEGLSYTPGYRLRGRWGDQLEKMIANLEETHYTRRAVANLWDSAFDHDNPNPPCFTQIGCNISNDTFYMTVFARSNDLYAAWPLDVLVMEKLRDRIMNSLESFDGFAGPLTYHITSAHIYEHDWENAEKEILRTFVRRNVFQTDPRGNFIIEIQGDKIHAYLIDPAGKNMIWETFSEDSGEIMAEILRNKMISRVDHAAYVSQELTKASLYLQNNLTYAQGRA